MSTPSDKLQAILKLAEECADTDPREPYDIVDDLGRAWKAYSGLTAQEQAEALEEETDDCEDRRYIDQYIRKLYPILDELRHSTDWDVTNARASQFHGILTIQLRYVRGRRVWVLSKDYTAVQIRHQHSDPRELLWNVQRELYDVVRRAAN